MNKAMRTFVIMGILLAVFYAIASVAHWAISIAVLYFAIAFVLIALSIRFLGYLIKHDKIRNKYK